MMKRLFLIALFACLVTTIFAQRQPLTYFLPDISYDEDIPTPEEFFGFQIGEWHLTHDRQYQYIRMLAERSPRVQLVEYARSYEMRPLVYLIITSEANQQRIDDIKAQHQALVDPERSDDVDISNLPSVLYQGFSVHGNESSGGNAAPLVAYYLAAGQSQEVQRLLDNVVILLDPCYNPDGFNRFASWVNVHKNKNMTADPNDREYDEAWPGGRTNHYWFDLNRDWMFIQHPESRGRIQAFHEWKPNVLTDHHEQGTNSTYHFSPGVPARTHPVTPQRNQELVYKIGTYHAKALDKIGQLYFTQESYDDFYYGKGAAYPDGYGAIGILFEQASSRGHRQESANGVLTFPATIRNQVTTALSTHEATYEMREELLEFQRDFHKNSLDRARRDKRRGYVFGDKHDPARVNHFLDILNVHQIEIHELAKSTTIDGQTYEPGSAYVVPTDQPHYNMVRIFFETFTEFEDSLFYDISTWTLPMAFNIPYAGINDRSLVGDELTEVPMPKTSTNRRASYAYLLRWDDYYAPAAANHLMANGLRAKVAEFPLTVDGVEYPQGTVMIPVVQGQTKSPDEVHELVREASSTYNVEFVPVSTGLTPQGIDLGSRSFALLQKPEVLLLVGDGVSSYDIGEAWHLLDQRYNIEVTKGEARDLARMDLNRYNVIVMADGSYYTVSQGGFNNLKEWLQDGGTLIAMEGAPGVLKRRGLSAVEFVENNDDDDEAAEEALRPYGMLSDDRRAQYLPGSIFEAKLDLTHPLGYGYQRETLPVFRRGNRYFKPAKNRYATPLIHTEEPLLSGYASQETKEQMANSAAIVVNGVGSGKVINFADNPNFRAFWFGTNKLFANAIFFGHVISGAATDRPSDE
jgi:hypothetical protein